MRLAGAIVDEAPVCRRSAGFTGPVATGPYRGHRASVTTGQEAMLGHERAGHDGIRRHARRWAGSRRPRCCCSCCCRCSLGAVRRERGVRAPRSRWNRTTMARARSMRCARSSSTARPGSCRMPTTWRSRRPTRRVRSTSFGAATRVATVPVGGSSSVVAAPRSICQTCGPRPESDAVFCSNCARYLPGVCEGCGAPVAELAARYCAGCGNRLVA